MKTLPVHIAPFSSEYAMRTIVAHTAPADAAFSNSSVFGGHVENGSFSKLIVSKFMLFHQRFQKAPFSQRSDVNSRPKRISFTPVLYENGAV